MPIATKKKLYELRADLADRDDEEAVILYLLLDVEIRRRENAGRKPSSPYTRQEQLRKAQETYRCRNLLRSKREIEKAEKIRRRAFGRN